MKSITTPTGTLEDAVQEWISTGERLGALEDQRSALQKMGSSAADASKARNRWIRTSHAMLSLIELLEEPGEAVLAISQRFRGAAAKAEVVHGSSDEVRASDLSELPTVPAPATPAVG